MTTISLSSLGKAFKQEWNTSTSFSSKIISVADWAYKGLSGSPNEEPSGLARAFSHAGKLSSIQKFPHKVQLLQEAFSNREYTFASARNIAIYTLDLGAKACSLISVAQFYQARLVGADSFSSETLATCKTGMKFLKSSLKLSEDLETKEWGFLEQLNALNHGAGAILQGYRLATILTGREKNSLFVINYKVSSIALDLLISCVKEKKVSDKSLPDLSKPFVAVGQTIVNVWKKSTDFVKYSTSATSGLGGLLGLIEHTPSTGWVKATADNHELFKLRNIFVVPQNLVTALKSGDPKAIFKQTTGSIKFGCTMLRIANRFNVWLPSFARFETANISKWKMRFEFLNFSVNCYDSSVALWKEVNRKTVAKAAGSYAITATLGYLNYTQFFKAKKNTHLLLGLSVVAVVSTVAGAYFNIDRPSK
ncbi:MAG: hypothetical protein ChlgKO_08910 [Chlamydiales bacterium]